MSFSTPTVASASIDRRLAGWALAFGALAWAIPFVVSTETTLNLTREDGPYETLGAIAFGLAGVLFCALFVRTRQSNRSWWLLVLAVLFLFAAGEEISWGQRALGWGEVDRATNVQGETTLHNLDVFDTVEGGWLKAPRLFFLFWLGWLVALPALTRTVEPIRTLCEKVRLPVPSLLFGLVMMTNLALSKSYDFLGLDETALVRVAEIRECAQAVVLVALALAFRLASGRAPTGDRQSPQPISTSSRPTLGVPT